MKNGKSGCEMPILYTTEIDDILRQSLEEVAKYKSEIVEELIRIYNSVDTKDKIEAETTKCKAEMDTILQRKDRLLDLSISGNLSNAEFAARNERFNAELKTLEDRLAELEKQRQDDENRVQYIRALKQVISRELDFSEGFTVGLVDALLDHMEVMGTEDKKVVHVTVYLKGMPEQQNYVIKRSKGKDFGLYQSIHMIRADIETAVSPIMGNEKQSEDMVNYLLQEFEGDTSKIWQSNIFGRSFHEVVSDDLHTKLKRMPEDARKKLQETLTRIINEGSGGLICIIL